MVGGRQAEVLHPPGDERRQQRREPVLEAERHPRIVLTTWSTGRPNAYLGMIQAPLRVEMKTRSATPLRDELGNDVDAAVADPDDHDPLAVQVERLGRIDVVVGVERRAVETPREVGERRVPVVAVADQQRIELVRRTIVGPDQPAAARRAARRARPPSRTRFARAARSGQRTRAGTGGSGCGAGSRDSARPSGSRAKLIAFLDVSMCSDRYADETAVGVAEVPVAADIVAGLKARVRHAPVAQRLAGDEAADTSPDYARAPPVSHPLALLAWPTA